MSDDIKNCPCCGKEAPEISDTQVWCDECCAIPEIRVRTDSPGDDEESEVAA